MKKKIIFQNLKKLKKNFFSFSNENYITKYNYYYGESHLKSFQKLIIGSSTICSIELIFELNKEYLSLLEKNLFLVTIFGSFLILNYSNYVKKKYIKIFKISKNKKKFFLKTFNGISEEGQEIFFEQKEIKNFFVDRIVNKGTIELERGSFVIDFDENEFEGEEFQVEIENCLNGIVRDESSLRKKMKKFN